MTSWLHRHQTGHVAITIAGDRGLSRVAPGVSGDPERAVLEAGPPRADPAHAVTSEPRPSATPVSKGGRSGRVPARRHYRADMPRFDLDQRPRGGRSRRKVGLVLVLAVSLLSAGCSSGQGAPRPSSPHPTSSASASSSPSAGAQPSKYTQTQLASRPCDALDGHDLAALGISGRGKQESGKHGPMCHWKLAGQNVNLALDLPLSYAKTMTKNGRVTQVPVGQHKAIQAEFQGICFIFVAVHDVNRLIGTTTIPDAGVSQEGTCPAGASVAAAALTHIR